MFTRFTWAFNFYLYILFIHSFVFGPYTLQYTIRIEKVISMKVEKVNYMQRCWRSKKKENPKIETRQDFRTIY